MISLKIYNIIDGTDINTYKPMIRDICRKLIETCNSNVTVVEIMYNVDSDDIREKEKIVSINNIIDTLGRDDRFLICAHVYGEYPGINNFTKSLGRIVSVLDNDFGFSYIKQYTYKTEIFKDYYFIYSNNEIGKIILNELSTK